MCKLWAQMTNEVTVLTRVICPCSESNGALAERGVWTLLEQHLQAHMNNLKGWDLENFQVKLGDSESAYK